MKFSVIYDEKREEEVVVYARTETKLIERLEALVNESNTELIGYENGDAVRLDVPAVCCFTVEDSRVFAVTEQGKYLLKLRLYQVEEKLDAGFVKINQSCVVNVGKIERFGATLGGSLMVTLKGGYRDYVSRRQMKTVKERIDL